MLGRSRSRRFSKRALPQGGLRSEISGARVSATRPFLVLGPTVFLTPLGIANRGSLVLKVGVYGNEIPVHGRRVEKS